MDSAYDEIFEAPKIPNKERVQIQGMILNRGQKSRKRKSKSFGNESKVRFNMSQGKEVSPN